MQYLKDINNEDIRKLEIRYYNGTIYVISDPQKISSAIKILREYPVIGFDTESKPSFRKGQMHKTALIQLAVPGKVFIFRINKTGLIKDIIELFEDPAILKTGISVRDDLHRLLQISAFKPEGFLELQKYSDSFLIESNSLKKLAAIVLGIRISKSQRLTNWEANELTEEQIIYAATDAWVCLEIYNRLSESAAG